MKVPRADWGNKLGKRAMPRAEIPDLKGVERREIRTIDPTSFSSQCEIFQSFVADRRHSSLLVCPSLFGMTYDLKKIQNITSKTRCSARALIIPVKE